MNKCAPEDKMNKCPPEDKISETDTKEIHGVLLSDEIKRLVDEIELIKDFNPENLQPAGYDFTIGNKFRREQEEFPLDEDHPNLTINPHEAVFVCTKEKLCMPRFLIGRWNLRIKRVWQGLVWVGGVHIDPGWQGELWCPIYNLSNKSVTLNYRDTFASVEFETTTLYNKNCKPYKNSSKDLTHPVSGLEKLNATVKEFPSRLEQYQSANFFIMSIIIGAMAVIALLPFGITGSHITAPWSDVILIGISFIALALAAFSILLHIKNWRFSGVVRKWRNSQNGRD